MAGIGDTKPIILEKGTQAKKASGSLGDTLVTRNTLYAEIKRSGGSRSFEQSQIKMADVYKMKVRHSGIDIDGTYKVVYRGRRNTVLSVEPINEGRFNYLLTVENK
jgi:head-tail adaptor